jgi:hypothetical protein
MRAKTLMPAKPQPLGAALQHLARAVRRYRASQRLREPALESPHSQRPPRLQQPAATAEAPPGRTS